jgi:hypothetical protein
LGIAPAQAGSGLAYPESRPAASVSLHYSIERISLAFHKHMKYRFLYKRILNYAKINVALHNETR